MPVDSGLHIPKEVGLLTVNSLLKLPIPWPRYQELRDRHVKPRQNDSLVVISLPWARQMHPDPTGARAKTIIQLVTQASVKLRAQGRVLVFVDFLSMPQRPFTAAQPPWTDEDNLVTIKVQETLPKLIFKADAVVHVSCASPQNIEDEGTTYSISAQELRRQCRLHEVGTTVQVAELHQSDQGASGEVRLFDQVISADGRVAKGLHDLPGDVFKCHAWCQLGSLGDWLAPGSGSSLELMRAPYGFKIETPADEQGRLFLERAICIVKLALTDSTSSDDGDTFFCDSAAVKSQICEAAAKIRKATAAGGEGLATELELLVEELESKKFTPQASTPAQSVSRLVSHAGVQPSEKEVTLGMMRAILDDLQILQSFKLFRAVRDDDMEECKRLLEQSGDPSLPDSRGITCLHHAAQVASINIVKILVESRASCEARDYNTGGTAAHHVPLFAVDATVEIVRLLSRDPTTLSQVNSAGVSAYERFYLWAEVACNGTPFSTMLNFLAKMPLNKTMLQEKWSANAVLSTMCWTPKGHEQDEDHVHVIPRCININGMRRVVYELRPSGVIEDTILYLGFCRLLPWSLQLPALKTVAFKIRCSIMCVGCEAVDAELLLEEDGGHRFHSDLFSVIDALPLPPMFAVLDSSFGLGINMLWRLQSRLWGALLLNVSWLFTSQFMDTTTHQRLKARAGQLASLASKQDIDKMVSMVSDFALLPAAMKIIGQPDKDATFKAEYRTALQQASSSFWRMSEIQPEWNFRHLTQTVSKRPAWEANACTVIIACGSHAPATAVQDSTFNLSMYLPISHQAYVPDSMWFWQCEGDRSISTVVGLIKRMKMEESSADVGTWATGTISVAPMSSMSSPT